MLQILQYRRGVLLVFLFFDRLSHNRCLRVPGRKNDGRRAGVEGNCSEPDRNDKSVASYFDASQISCRRSL